MSWADVGQIAAASIASAGGIGAIMIGVVTFSTKKIADQMDRKFQATLDQKLEKYKSELSKKEYVSKTKFDTEFSLYRELSSTFADMINAINTLIPAGLSISPADREERLKYEKKCYEAAYPLAVKARNTLSANIPFVSDKIYDGYAELLHLTILQLGEYEDRFVVTNLCPQEEKERFSPDAYKRTREINKKWKTLNSSIREYISKLDVMEDK